MTDVTTSVNELLKGHNTALIKHPNFSLEHISAFLKEAYQINSRIKELITYLRSIRRPYLQGSPPARRKHVTRHDTLAPVPDNPKQYLTDTQRDQIDAEAKSVLRDLHVAISSLSQAEEVRQNAESALSQNRHRRHGFGALGQWAAGGGVSSKSPQEELREAEASSLKLHREGVLWYLQQKLAECGKVQSRMMEIRLVEEVEKSNSVLYKARGHGGPVPVWDDSLGTGVAKAKPRQRGGRSGISTEAFQPGQLSEDQMQLFAQDNQDMLKQYEDRLDQVRTAERSLLDISELQSTLAANLEIQSAHIDQLVQDSYFVSENIGGGNKELKKASERKSTARMTFYGIAGLCTVLVAWDAIF